MIKEEVIDLLDSKISKSSFNNFEAFIFAVCLFLLTPPFYLWNSISPLFFIVICIVLSIRNIRNFNLVHLIFSISFLFLYAFFSLKNDLNFFGFLIFMSICILTIISEEFLKNVLNKYIYIFSITIIPSIIIYLLVYFFGKNIPNSIIEPYNQLRTSEYFRYPFLVSENIYDNMLLPRFYGYYDEPGVVGTVSGVILLCQGYNLKKWINIPVFIAGLLSFSLAFIIISLVYGFIFLQTKYKILIAAVIIGIVILFTGNEVLDGYIFSRFEFENGKFVGDNRIGDDYANFYNQFSNSKDYYFGLGQNAAADSNFGGATYKDLIVSYGIIAFVFFITLFMLMAYTRFQFRKEFFLYLFILFSVLYQRPFIGSFLYMFLLFAPLSFLNKTTTDENYSLIHDSGE